MKIDLHYSNNPPFCDADFEQKGLGGTEGFIIQVFRELCGQQHQVALYNKQPQLVPLVDEMPDGRKWSSVERFNPKEDRDILISFRMREVFDLHPKGFKVIILADTESIGLGDQVREGKVDLVMFVSQWQKDKIATEEGIPDDKCLVTANGIKAAEYRKSFEKVPGMCIHTSTPERGLKELLNIWPKIQVVMPQMSLHLFSSFYGWGMSEEQNYEWSAENYGKATTLADKNVTNHIHVGATELREWQLQSQLFLYPTQFKETCCLHGDTIINMPCDHRYGQGIPIKYLEGMSDFPVYTYNEKTHRFTLGTAKKVWKARSDAQTIEIAFEEGTKLILTPDHLVHTYDGEWVPAGQLKVGQRLTGLNYRYRVHVNIGDGGETHEARLVGEWLLDRKIDSDKHVHHLDFEGLDNSPGMVNVLPASIHHKFTHRGKVMHSTSTKIAREGFSKWAQTEEGQAYLKTRNKRSVEKMWEKMRALPEEEFRAWLKMRGAKRVENYYKKKALMTEEELQELHDYHSRIGAKGSKKAWDIIRSWPEEKQKAYFHDRSVKAYESRRRNLELAKNHVIESIKTGPVTDVYDMEVEPYHNFVAGGVVVHNCISALEAAAAGCVLICSDVAALRERVIDGETGFLIPGEAGTFEHDFQFVSEVIQLMHQPEKIAEMSNAAKEYAKNYTYEVLVKGWMEEWSRRMG